MVSDCDRKTLRISEGFELLEWLWKDLEPIVSEVSVNPSKGRHSQIVSTRFGAPHMSETCAQHEGLVTLIGSNTDQTLLFVVATFTSDVTSVRPRFCESACDALTAVLRQGWDQNTSMSFHQQPENGPVWMLSTNPPNDCKAIDKTTM